MRVGRSACLCCCTGSFMLHAALHVTAGALNLPLSLLLMAGAPVTAPPAQWIPSRPTPLPVASLLAFVMWRRSECGCRDCCRLQPC